MVQAAVHRSAYHLPPGFLRLPGGEEMVGAVQQAALARHHRHLPEGAPGGVRGVSLSDLSGHFARAPGAERVRARMIRRTIIRYLLLAYILCIRRNSSRLSKRFPNMATLVKTGIIRSDEALRIGNEEARTMFGSRYCSGLGEGERVTPLYVSGGGSLSSGR